MNTTDRVYAFLVSYWRDHAEPPTYREILAAVGIRSLSTAHYHVQRLAKDGRIDCNRVPQSARKFAKKFEESKP